jgi:hypothetical protein
MARRVAEIGGRGDRVGFVDQEGDTKASTAGSSSARRLIRMGFQSAS